MKYSKIKTDENLIHKILITDAEKFTTEIDLLFSVLRDACRLNYRSVLKKLSKCKLFIKFCQYNFRFIFGTGELFIEAAKFSYKT